MADVVYSFVAAVYLVGFWIILLFSVCSIWLGVCHIMIIMIIIIIIIIYLFIYFIIIFFGDNIGLVFSGVRSSLRLVVREKRAKC